VVARGERVGDHDVRRFRAPDDEVLAADLETPARPVAFDDDEVMRAIVVGRRLGGARPCDHGSGDVVVFGGIHRGDYGIHHGAARLFRVAALRRR
jgi:hypothetical protein